MRPKAVSPGPARSSASGTSSRAIAASRTPPPNEVTIAAARSGKVNSATATAPAKMLAATTSPQPIVAGGRPKRFAITLLGSIGFALAFATVLGGTVLADASDELIGTAQALAAGAVLAVVSVAIIPHAFSAVSRLVASATVTGFIVGYLLS